LIDLSPTRAQAHRDRKTRERDQTASALQSGGAGDNTGTTVISGTTVVSGTTVFNGSHNDNGCGTTVFASGTTVIGSGTTVIGSGTTVISGGQDYVCWRGLCREWFARGLGIVFCFVVHIIVKHRGESRDGLMAYLSCILHHAIQSLLQSTVRYSGGTTVLHNAGTTVLAPGYAGDDAAFSSATIRPIAHAAPDNAWGTVVIKSDPASASAGSASASASDAQSGSDDAEDGAYPIGTFVRKAGGTTDARQFVRQFAAMGIEQSSSASAHASDSDSGSGSASGGADYSTMVINRDYSTVVIRPSADEATTRFSSNTIRPAAPASAADLASSSSSSGDAGNAADTGAADPYADFDWSGADGTGTIRLGHGHAGTIVMPKRDPADVSPSKQAWSVSSESAAPAPASAAAPPAAFSASASPSALSSSPLPAGDVAARRVSALSAFYDSLGAIPAAEKVRAIGSVIEYSQFHLDCLIRLP
jgi:hypothetical protein